MHQSDRCQGSQAGGDQCGGGCNDKAVFDRRLPCFIKKEFLKPLQTPVVDRISEVRVCIESQRYDDQNRCHEKDQCTNAKQQKSIVA